jgi:glycosyltransferase involved in cell wall biosynthesis
MHVVVVGDYPAYPNKISGGVESVILYLTQALQRYPDLKLDVVTLDRWGLGQRSLEHENITVHYVPSARLPGRLSILANIRRMQAEMTRLQPDLIHAHIAGAYAEAAAATGLPWVLTLHGVRFLEASLRTGFLNRIYRGWFIKREELRALERAEHIIAISPFIQTTFNGHLRGQVYDIENPISDSFFELAERGQPGQLLFVGRLIPRKGVHTLLHAFAELHRRMPEARLRLAGGGISVNDPTSYYQELRQFVANNGLEEAVTFLGELNEPAILEEYSNCAAVVLSSVLETAPMAIMQAMAAGRAVVSTDAGGARYLVEPGESGYIVPLNNPAALVEALYQTLGDETKLWAMGRRAKEIARQRFHADVVAARTRDVYYRMLGETPPNYQI